MLPTHRPPLAPALALLLAVPLAPAAARAETGPPEPRRMFTTETATDAAGEWTGGDCAGWTAGTPTPLGRWGSPVRWSATVP